MPRWVQKKSGALEIRGAAGRMGNDGRVVKVTASASEPTVALVLGKLQEIAGLAFKLAAERFEGAKAHGLGFVGFENGKIGEREVHAPGQLGERDTAVGHHLIEVEADGHGLDGEVVFLFEGEALPEGFGKEQDQESGEHTIEEW